MQPNVILIILDTARADSVCTRVGGEQVTPTLTEIAENGVRYPNAFTPAPWTLPAHASLFTGTYPSKHGTSAEHVRLDTELETVAEVLAEAEYETIGVSNNTWISEVFEFDRGFDSFHQTWQYFSTETDFGPIARLNEQYSSRDILTTVIESDRPVRTVANAIYGAVFRKRRDSGARRTNKLVRTWLDDRNRDRPFFLFLNYLEPHLEYRPPRAHAERFLTATESFDDAMDIPQDAWRYLAGDQEITDEEFDLLRALYLGELSYLDERIRELRDHLRSVGEWENTILLVTGDHGENIGDHGLMDHQYCLYDTLLHVPLIAAGGPFSGGEADDKIVQIVDIFPTLLDVLDLEAPTENAIQGTSFAPGTTTERETAYAEYLHPQPSMDALEERVGDLSDSVRRYDRSLRSIRTADWKLICGSDGSRELYDLTTKPSESTNVAAENPEIVRDLETELDEWLESYDRRRADDDVEIDQTTKRRLEELGYLR